MEHQIKENGNQNLEIVYILKCEIRKLVKYKINKNISNKKCILTLDNSRLLNRAKRLMKAVNPFG